MSMKMAVDIKNLKDENKAQAKRLDSLYKSVTRLQRAVSHLERSPDTKSGVRVPQTPRPETLGELEIGRETEGA